MRCENDPYSSQGLTVRKILGSAYEVVKCVYEHLDYVKVVANNMAAVVNSANNVHRNIVTVTGETSHDAGGTTTILFPSGITQAEVLDSNVLVMGTDDALYGPGDSTFSWKVTSTGVSVTMSDDAASELLEAQIRWVLSYESN